VGEKDENKEAQKKKYAPSKIESGFATYFQTHQWQIALIWPVILRYKFQFSLILSIFKIPFDPNYGLMLPKWTLCLQFLRIPFEFFFGNLIDPLISLRPF
jgi:hypothetical protein